MRRLLSFDSCSKKKVSFVQFTTTLIFYSFCKITPSSKTLTDCNDIENGLIMGCMIISNNDVWIVLRVGYAIFYDAQRNLVM